VRFVPTTSLYSVTSHKGSRRTRSYPALFIGVAVALLGGVIPAVSAPALAAPPADAVTMAPTSQVTSQILLQLDDTWVTTASSVTPAITNYEYSTDSGATWRAFDPPITTPVKTRTGAIPTIGVCTESSNGQPFSVGTRYGIALRAINSDGPGPASDVRFRTFRAFDTLEMNPCGGTWGGQDLKIMTGGTTSDDSSYFNRFGIYRGGLDQIFNGSNGPGDYCFYLFAQSSVIGCERGAESQPLPGFYVAPGVDIALWDTVNPAVTTNVGDTWTIDQSAEAIVNGRSYVMATRLEYTKPNGYVDVRHQVTTPDVSDLAKTPTASAALGDDTVVVSDATGLVIGMCAAGDGIPLRSVIKEINGTTVTLDNNTTSALANSPVTFSACTKLYHSSDMYLDGDDNGPGDSSLIAGNLLVAQVTNPGNVDPGQGFKGGVGGILEVSGSPFSSWAEDYFICMFGGLGCPGSPYGVHYGGSWPDTVDPNPTADAGTAAEWDLNPDGAAGTYTVRTRIFFSAASPTISGNFSAASTTTDSPVNLVLNLNNAPLWNWASGEFDVTLPPGAEAGTPATTCTNATVSVANGVLQLRNASLDNDGLACTITVPLTFNAAGTYTVTGADVSNGTIEATGSASSQKLGGFITGSVVVNQPAPPPSLPPSKPLNVVAEPGDGVAVITWDPPASSGSFPITTYRVSTQPGGDSCLAAAPETTCTVANLINGTEYRFVVEALNGAGWGPLSDPSDVVIPGPQVTPTIVITGTRVDDRLNVEGTTTNIAAGTRFTPHVSLDDGPFTEGVNIRPLAENGTFTWTRRVLRGKDAAVFFSDGVVQSNTLQFPITPTILISGSRNGERVTVEGTTTNLRAATRLTPMISINGSAVRAGTNIRRLGSDQKFTWKRRVLVKNTLTVYFTNGTVDSNSLTLQP
jgi:hypothetical protein